MAVQDSRLNDLKHVIGSDTDSMYYVMTSLLQKLWPDFDYGDVNNRQEKIKKLLLIADHIEGLSNDNLSNISSNLFNVNGKHYFELKQEVLAEKVYWSGKRRYAMYIVNKEGVEIEELVMVGLDLVKSNFPEYFRTFGKQLLKDILFSVPKETIDKNVMDFRLTMDEVDWKKLLKPTGLKKLDEYIEEEPSEDGIFSKLKKRCPTNTRSASRANDLLRHLKLNDRYPEFNLGDKMYIAMLKDNPYKIQVLGLNGYNDPPEFIDFVDKYIDREAVFESVFAKKLDKVYSDIGWDLILNPFSLMFFTFD